MKQYQTHGKFIEGIDKSLPDRDISDNSLSDGRNMQITSGGDLETRPGTEVVYEMPENQKSIYRFYQSSLDKKTTISTGGTKIYHDDTEVYSGLTPNQRFYWENYHDTAYGVNGADGLFKDDGVTVTDVTGDTLADSILVDVTQKDECLYVTDGDFLWESDLGNPEHYDANSFKRIPTTGGARVVRIKTHLSGNIAIYTNNDIFVLRGSASVLGGTIADNTYSLDSLDAGFGLIAPKTLITVDGEHVGLGLNGAFVFDGSNAKPFPNWEKVQPYFEQADPEMLPYATAKYDKKKIYFSFASYGSSYNDYTIVFDVVKGCFYPLWEGFKVNEYVSYDGVGDTNELYFADAETNEICKFNPNIAADKGVVIEAYADTKAFSYGDSAADKKGKKVKIKTENGSGTVEFSYNQNNTGWSTPQTIDITTSVVWGQAGIEYYSDSNPGTQTWRWGDGLGIQQDKASVKGKSKFIKYRIKKDGKFTLIELTPFFRVRKAK